MKTGFIAGIGGASRTGKTTLARTVQSLFPPEITSLILHQDDFIRPRDTIPMIRDVTNWEHPDSIDFSRLRHAIFESAKVMNVVIVEGFLLYHDMEIAQRMDLRLYLQIDKKEFFRRRKEDRRYGPDADWYIEHVWESYLKFGQKPENLRFSALTDPQSVADHILMSVRS